MDTGHGCDGHDSRADPLPSPPATRVGGPQDLSLSPAAPTVSAGVVREGLHLTPHQLGELTRHLGLEVGDRANYPRYGFAQVHLLVAVKALRELHVPVEDACRAVTTYHNTFAEGRGWIVVSPVQDRWVALTAVTVEALLSLLTLTGRAITVDLPTLREHAHTAWLRLANGRTET